MARSRQRNKSGYSTKKENRRLAKVQAFKVATQVRLMAASLANQDQLDTMLLGEPDVSRREQMFTFIKPFLKFPDPRLPSTIISPASGIIRP